MSRDPYELLGVKRDATQKEIQSAYRKLAKKLHPDLNPGDKDAERKFKDISAAYGIVGDEDKRGRFDRGEIDVTGAEQAPRNFYRDYAGAGARGSACHNGGGFADFGEGDDLFSSFFSRRARGGGSGMQMQGHDRHFNMEVEFLDALNGATRTVSLPDGATAANTVIAYEPVWAIGTGLTPTPADVEQVHAAIRRDLSEVAGAEGANIRILYGGSVKPDNAAELMAIPNVNGALVGGASLKASDFLAILRAYEGR